MKVIGLTGGIATGKSTVSTMLAAHGAAIVDADVIARELVGPGRPALERVAKAFGQQIIRADGSLDRSALAEIVFADRDARCRLEAILHPSIRDLMTQRIDEALHSRVPLVVASIPLLFENEGASDYDGVLVVWAAPDTQVRRVVERDGISLAASDEKRRRATWTINNDGPLSATRQTVASWWESEVFKTGEAPEGAQHG